MASLVMHINRLIQGEGHELESSLALNLQGHWRAFTGAGTRPLLLGLVTWAAVALSSLAIQAWGNLL